MMKSPATTATAVESLATHEVDEYTRMVSDRFAPLKIDSDRPGNFRGSIRGRGLGDIEVFDVRATQHHVERSEPRVADSHKGVYMLHLQLSGVGIMRQDGREALLQPGDMAFYNSDRAYSLWLDDRFRNAILVFPQRLLALPLGAADQLTATGVSGTQGLGRIVSPFLAQLAGNLDSLPGQSGLRLARNTVDLITTVLQSTLGLAGMERPEQGSKQNLRERVRAYIEDNLADPALSPTQIAAAHFISVRQLHAVFSQEGTSVSTWIRARRLELCREDLTDPLQDFRPVSAVAARRGLVDAAHFSRLFKATYGESPRQFRDRLRSGDEVA
jgi:AraC-like DNA-binding protein